MANTAEDLYNGFTDIPLTAEHNNAAVTVMMRNDQPVAVMYAIRDIIRGTKRGYYVHHYHFEDYPLGNALVYFL